MAMSDVLLDPYRQFLLASGAMESVQAQSAPGSSLANYKPGSPLPEGFLDQMRSKFARPQDGAEYTDPETGYNFAPKYKEVDGQFTFDGGTLYKIQGKGDYKTPGYVFDASGKATDPGFQIEHKAPGFMDNYGFLLPLAAPFAATALGVGAGGGAGAGATGGAAAGGAAAGGAAASGSAAAEAAFNAAIANSGIAYDLTSVAEFGAGAVGGASAAETAFTNAVNASGIPYDATSAVEIGGSVSSPLTDMNLPGHEATHGAPGGAPSGGLPGGGPTGGEGVPKVGLGEKILDKLGSSALNSVVGAGLASVLFPSPGAVQTDQQAAAAIQEELKKPIPMPDPVAQEQARRRSIIAQLGRHGRSSTIMTNTGSGKLGG